MLNLKTILTMAVAATTLSIAAPALAQDVKLGILADLTGPIESLAPPIVAGAQLAWDEVNAQGGILDGGKVIPVVGDSACDATAASAAGDKLV
ncbi:MAG TPA: ABC transporter substrate-binding protein, partial [Devosia sp.]|nr:ABC transporter substrate-binding protein [Devosia sp.]